MPIFGWKKTKKLEEMPKVKEEKIEVPSQPPAPPQALIPVSAPLFVKLEKYKTIESNLNELNINLNTLKNSFAVFKEVESVREGNFKVIQETLEKMEKNVSSLLAEFGKTVKITEEVKETETMNLSKILVNLKQQIDQLKTQLEKF